MSAFLFVPSTQDARQARRVDFANIGSLFAEAEEIPATGGTRAGLKQVAAAVLILLLALSDMVLLGRPDAVACLFKPQQMIGAPI